MRAPSSVAAAEPGDVGHALAPRAPNGYRIRRRDLARSKLSATNRTSTGFGSTVVVLVLWPERKAQTDGSRIESANAGAITATGRADAVEAQNASVV
jgi:hypothetical protein